MYVYSHATMKIGLNILNSKIFFAIFTNWLFLSFCESIFKPKAVFAITSIVNMPADLKKTIGIKNLKQPGQCS